MRSSNPSRPSLSAKHLAELKASGIGPKARAARGYRTVTKPEELRAAGFSASQSRLLVPGLLVPMYGPTGDEPVLHQIKPDNPRMDKRKGRLRKYETPDGAQLRLDFPPTMREKILDPTVPLGLTEGVKKADCLASRGFPCVPFTGVDCWMSGGEPLPDWEAIPLADRDTSIMYDSDSMTKVGVRGALERLTRYLVSRGARVKWVMLPPGPKDVFGNCPKVAVDDWLGADRTRKVRDLLRLAVLPKLPRWPARSWDDFGNAHRLEDRYEDRLRWVMDNKSWAVYDPKTGLWSISANERAQGLARTTVERMGRQEAANYSAALGSGASKAPEGSERKDWLAWAGKCASYARIQAMLSQTRDRRRMFACMADFDQDDDLLHCTNGVLNLKTMELLPHDPKYMLTVGANAAYEPAARSELWREYLKTFLPGRELRTYIQKIVGYTLLAGNPERMFIIVHGPGSTGKSTLREMMNATLGGYAKPIEMSFFRTSQTEKPRADLASALNARFVSASEAKAEWELHSDHIKQLTGGDTMRARYPHEKGYVERVPAFTPWLFTNAMPTIKGRDEAFDRRLVAPLLSKSVAGKDEKTKARDEMRKSAEVRAAFLAWAVAGLRLYREQGLEPPKSVVRSTLRARAELSDTDRFLYERCREGDGFREIPRALYRAYWNWCLRRNIPERDRLTETAFGKAMTGRGHDRKQFKVDGRPVWYRIGIELKRNGDASVVVRSAN